MSVKCGGNFIDIGLTMGKIIYLSRLSRKCASGDEVPPKLRAYIDLEVAAPGAGIQHKVGQKSRQSTLPTASLVRDHALDVPIHWGNVQQTSTDSQYISQLLKPVAGRRLALCLGLQERGRGTPYATGRGVGFYARKN
ncbi:hypothetical protein AGABI2DRAFT_178596 [Agaricus bisporus var. bisporus H97]|uniref:hypothetical protein n=1 Tax=Agaricus bisporus var. bisporus (strain H97 / ATCC MYA-4626 / FGSC 10389) TaxID=936046 RepID=UPI00029F5346|nr:hypothetical protein AGABI2DRAFT_178596 [Agaricus bisporus var. bisporus H97]EKV47788.1 hypothetical protein AGABI2DRAFT_178596 [Agaricus bisporus var. bisporus H97]